VVKFAFRQLIVVYSIICWLLDNSRSCSIPTHDLTLECVASKSLLVIVS